MKAFLVSLLAAYILFYVSDWFWAYRHADKAFCQHIMSQPLSFLILVPGIGEGCIDKGVWP